MIQTTQAKPMSAMLSSVSGPGVSQSSTLMPRARSSATSARMSLTCHAAWVLPVGLQAELAEVELPGRGEVGGQQRGGDRMVSKPGNVTRVVRRPPAYAGWILALWWNWF
jgi:hypothetical protein